MATRVPGPGPQPATTDHVCDRTDARFAESSLSSSTGGYCPRLIENHAPARRRRVARSVPSPSAGIDPRYRPKREDIDPCRSSPSTVSPNASATSSPSTTSPCELAPGRVVGLLGPNGAGKTTTLRMLLGLVAPTAGSATIDGQPYRDLDEPIRHIGAVLEATSFHPGRRAREHLRAIAATAGLPDDRVDEVLADVALTGVARRRVGGFSLGMRQRLGLAAALLGEPEILVLDEPTNGLDPEGVRWLRDFVRGYAAAGHTVLVSSHLLAEVAQTVDEVVVLVAGRLVAHAPLSELPGSRPTVRIRTPQATALRIALDAHGIEAEQASPERRARPRRRHRDRRTGHRRRRPRRLRDRPGPHRPGAGLPRPHHHRRDRSPTMNDLIRSELRKQRSVRLPAIALTAAAAAGVLTAIALITTAGHDGNPPLHRGSLTELVHAPYAIVAGAALLLGILGVAGEFRHQTITATLLAAPRRGRLLTAKVIVHAGLGALLAVVAAAVNLAVAIPWLSSRGVALVRACRCRRGADRWRRRRCAVRCRRCWSRCPHRQPDRRGHRQPRLAARRGRTRRQRHLHPHHSALAARRRPLHARRRRQRSARRSPVLGHRRMRGRLRRHVIAAGALRIAHRDVT